MNIIPRNERQESQGAQWKADYARLLRDWYGDSVQESIDAAEVALYHTRDEGGELMFTPQEYLAYMEDEGWEIKSPQ